MNSELKKEKSGTWSGKMKRKKKKIVGKKKKKKTRGKKVWEPENNGGMLKAQNIQQHFANVAIEYFLLQLL